MAPLFAAVRLISNVCEKKTDEVLYSEGKYIITSIK
jgi:hypothetical protein